MTSLLTKRASLLISLVLVAVLAPTTGALAANDHANDKGKCLSAEDTRPWDCLDSPGMVVAPPAQEPEPSGTDDLALDHVQRGTRIVFADLEVIKDQQSLTKNALQTLTDVQTLHNKVAFQEFKGQGDLSSAVEAADGLNDIAKEQIRRQLFEYEEFTKSASSVISKITQILEKIASGIRG